jgi:hypothetical protein
MSMRWLALCVIALAACGTAGKTGSVKSAEPAKESLKLERTAGENKIVFLTMGLWLQDSVKDTYGFTQKGVMYANGQIKRELVYGGTYEPYQLYWEIRDVKGNLAGIGNTPDPLYRSFETSDEQSGRLEKHLLSAGSGEITIRFNLNDQSTSISIHKLSNGKLKKLYEAKLL